MHSPMQFLQLVQYPFLKEELKRMESLWVISRVEGPTELCAGMVVVLKKAEAVLICVDFRVLNESVLR